MRNNHVSITSRETRKSDWNRSHSANDSKLSMSSTVFGPNEVVPTCQRKKRRRLFDMIFVSSPSLAFRAGYIYKYSGLLNVPFYARSLEEAEKEI